MKKILSFSLAIALPLILLAVGGASASAQTITAMATEPYMETYALYACEARIYAFDPASGALEVGLIIPEIFRGDEVESLVPGDAVFTGGREVPIGSVERESGYVVLNGGEGAAPENTVRLAADARGNYRPVTEEGFVWTEMARLFLPVTERLLFLDGIDPATGEPLDKPSVHAAGEFLQRLAEEKAGATGPGFEKNNVIVVFDADGQLAVIGRHPVPGR